MTSATGTDRTHELAQFLAALSYAAIPPRVIERAKDLILDHIGVALHSAGLPWTAIVRDYALRGSGNCTIYGNARKTSARDAALVNGTAAHGIELDDTHNESFSHPGTVVIPAAFALAESAGISGENFLTAVVAGYEAQCRAGSAATAAMSHGFHGTAVSGVFGATAAAASVMKLPTARLESAFGLAVSMASGVMQFTEDPEGNMVKRLHGGLPAQNGILAAELAGAGLSGPRGGLDGRYGFVRMFGRSDDASRLTTGLGSAWEIDNISVKLYACCRMFHAFVDALRECSEEGGFKAADVASAEIVMPQQALEGRMQYRPRSVMAAQYSLPYAAAATLLLDPQDPRSFSEQAITRPDMLELMDRITGTGDAALDRMLPAKYPGGARVKLKNGRSYERTLPDSVGTPERPLNRAGIESKFRALTSGIVTPQRQQQIIDSVFSLEQADGVKKLGAAVTGCLA